MTGSLNAIGLVVADIAASVAFYRMMGLSFASDTEQHVDCEFAPGVRLMLDTEDMIRSLFPDWKRPTGDPQLALAFQFDRPSEVDDKVAELAKTGYRVVKEPYDAFWGQRYATVHDPDGNAVDLYATL
jgi:catechol 2,3-dioxygenase-like lactoylglutathione lyase family enzyme